MNKEITRMASFNALTCAPEPDFLIANDEIATDESKCSLKVLFYIIYRLNKQQVNYVLDDEARLTFNSIFNRLRGYCKKFHMDDNFIGYLIFKGFVVLTFNNYSF